MKIGRNAPCPCGSGKKYKKCCMNKTQPPVDLLWRRLREAHDQLMDRLMHFTKESLGETALLMAAGEFLLWPETDEAPGDLLEDHMPLFMPWFLFNWTYDPDEADIRIDMPAHQTIAETYAQRYGKRLDSYQQRLIEAIANVPYTFLEVVSCNPGQGFRLRDVFTGIEHEVVEKQGSEHARPGDLMLTRVVRVDHVAMLAGASLFLFPPQFKAEIVELRKIMQEDAGKITEEVLTEYDQEIREHYFCFLNVLKSPPQLQNTDGEPLLLNTLHFAIEDPQETFDKLADLAVVEDAAHLRRQAVLDENGRVVRAEIPWSKHGNETHQDWDNTILGRLLIDGKKLTVEVNSEARAKTIRREIENRLGTGATYRTTTVQSPEAMMEKGRDSDFGGPLEALDQDELLQSPEVYQQIERVLGGHWEGWIDESIPALGNQTPRQAVKTADGREKVEALLQDARRHMDKDVLMRTVGSKMIDGVRNRLGLDHAPAGGGAETSKDKQKQRTEDIKGLIEDFGRAHLGVQYTDFALKLCDRISGMRNLNVQRGRTEIWAAAIIYVIARLNFLFDPESDLYITPADICEHFGTVKSTIGNKATTIEKVCGLGMGNKDFCRQDIVDMLTFYESPEGFIMPKSSFTKSERQGRPATGKPKSGGRPAVEQVSKKKNRMRNDGQKETDKQDPGKKETPLSRQLKLFDDD